MSTINKEQAIDLDSILNYLKNKEGSSIKEINQKLLSKKTYSYCKTLITILDEHQPKLIKDIEDIGFDEIVFFTTDYISTFLQDGGFTKLYNLKEKKNKRENEKENFDFINSQDEAKSKRSKKVKLWLKIITLILGILIALYQLAPNIIELTKTIFSNKK